jgi:hypothetical protein
MHFCYIDESGTADVPGNTSHFVLAGISIPVWHWKKCDRDINAIKAKYALSGTEIHVAWILRKYREQFLIDDFDSLGHNARQYEVEKHRNADLLRLQRSSNPKRYRQARKNYKKTNDYVHLSYAERQNFIREIAQSVSGWGFARLFAECIDKVHFNPARSPLSIDEQAFEQVISRFEQYLENIRGANSEQQFGLLIHDNNDTVARKHTELMKVFHQRGTFWTNIANIIETPLFVDSQLTSMVQIADLCGYALRRYLENGEEELFDMVFQRADRKENIVVGVRHFTDMSCSCKICRAHRL